ncbi:OprO/OprP family phosphate-selective porin [Cyclobacteriaceae bacterium]|nr:OprO/OprP family phosphate-selective porin [Cyclobacteriaceae bacterium]
MIKTTITRAAILIGLLLPFVAKAQLVSEKTFGKGFNFVTKDTTASMKIHVRMQNLMEVGINDFVYGDVASEPTVKFLVRRYRLKFGGFVYDKRLRYKMELGISNRDQGNFKNAAYNSYSSNIVLDAVLKYKFNKHWDFWFGQTKLPGNRERVVSSANLQFVDRSRVNSLFNIDRDAGIQLHGEYGGDNFMIRPKFAISTGEGRNITSNSFGGLSYTTRLEILPLGKFEGKKADYVLSDLDRQSKPKIAFGFTYNYNDGAARQGGQLGYFVTDTITGKVGSNDLQVFFADMIFKYKGFSLLTEYANKWGNKVDNLDRQFTTGQGFMASAGYLFKNNFEVAGRYTFTDGDDDIYSSTSERTEYTLALSKYLVGHNLKIQTDLGYYYGSDAEQGDLLYRLQVELQL